MPSKPFEVAYEAAKANNFKPMKEFINCARAGFDTVERVLQNIQHLVEQSRDAGWMLSVHASRPSELTDIFRVIRTDAGLLTAARARDSWSATPKAPEPEPEPAPPPASRRPRPRPCACRARARIWSAALPAAAPATSQARARTVASARKAPTSPFFAALRPVGDDDEAEISSFCEEFISDVISRRSPPPRSPPFFPPARLRGSHAKFARTPPASRSAYQRRPAARRRSRRRAR